VEDRFIGPAEGGAPGAAGKLDVVCRRNVEENVCCHWAVAQEYFPTVELEIAGNIENKIAGSR